MFQYIIRAQKSGHESQNADKTVNSSIEAGNLEGAKKTIEEYLKLHPVDMDMLYKHAEICSELGHHDKAIESLQKILIFNPERKDALNLREKIMKGNLQSIS